MDGAPPPGKSYSVSQKEDMRIRATHKLGPDYSFARTPWVGTAEGEISSSPKVETRKLGSIKKSQKKSEGGKGHGVKI